MLDRGGIKPDHSKWITETNCNLFSQVNLFLSEQKRVRTKSRTDHLRPKTDLPKLAMPAGNHLRLEKPGLLHPDDAVAAVLFCIVYRQESE